MALNTEQMKVVTKAILALLDAGPPAQRECAKELFSLFADELVAKRLVSGALFWVASGNGVLMGHVESLGLKR